MSRKVRRVPYHLDPADIKQLPHNEIVAILRGADDLIMSGGRSMLAKILKESRDKRVLELELDQSPVYGCYKHLTLQEITERIDWVILNGYLTIEYDYRLPMLVYTPRGWEIERETYAEELLQGFDRMIASGTSHYDMGYLKDRDRGMILLLLDKVENSGNPKYIPLLKAWEEVDYKKVQARIRQVVAKLAGENT
jgi:superfamily II DNA helicase RecQ